MGSQSWSCTPLSSSAITGGRCGCHGTKGISPGGAGSQATAPCPLFFPAPPKSRGNSLISRAPSSTVPALYCWSGSFVVIAASMS